MARTALFDLIRRALAKAHAVHRTGQSPAELAAQARGGPSRRQVLGGALATAALLPTVGCGDNADAGSPDAGAAPTIAIIGGGTAGLHCAYRLAEAGVRATVYEASARVGGRMFTGRGLFAGGQTCELGGELVDSGHVTIQALCTELELTLDDLVADAVGLRNDTFHFDGRIVEEAELVEAFTPLAAIMAATVTAAEADDEEFARVDAMSISTWLADEGGLDATSLIRRVLEVAYTGEYGLEVDQQSIFNLLYLIDYEEEEPFRLFGDSDERFHIHQGSDAVPAGLAAALADDVVELERPLTRVVAGADGRFVLSFAAGADVVADHVVFAVPFATLRDVDLGDAGLPADKQRAIDELGYGTNAKLMGGFARRTWRVDHQASGSSFSDVGDLQTTWDSARGQAGDTGILTDFVGGDRGMAMAQGSAEERMVEILPWLDVVFPGSSDDYTAGTAVRQHWPSAPFQKGSYACYRPGQWEFWSTEGTRVGNLHFCGEHTSLEFQGYMEGAAETGALVAAEILDDLNTAPSPRLRAILDVKLALPQACYHGGQGRRLRRSQRRKLARLAATATR